MPFRFGHRQPCLAVGTAVPATSRLRCCLPAPLLDRRREQRLLRVYTDASVPRRRPSNPSSGASVLSPDVRPVPGGCRVPPFSLRAPGTNPLVTPAPQLVPSSLFRACLSWNCLPACFVAPPARLPCASLVTPPRRRLDLTTAPFPVRTARTTPPLYPSLCFKTPMRCVHTVVHCARLPALLA